MITSLRSLVQLFKGAAHSRHVMKTNSIFFLVIVLLINVSYSPAVVLAQNEPCAEIISEAVDTEDRSSDLFDNYYTLTDTLKESDKIIKEQIDIFTYSASSNPYIPLDVDTLNVSLETNKASECAWGSDYAFLCYKLVADLVFDTGEVSNPSERGIGGLYIKPGKTFEAIRDKTGVWQLEDGENTFIIVDYDDYVTLQKYIGEVPAEVYDSIPVEIDIPSSGTLSFTLNITKGEYDAEGNYTEKDYFRKFTDYKVEDNSIFTVDVDSSGNPTLRRVYCRADGQWR